MSVFIKQEEHLEIVYDCVASAGFASAVTVLHPLHPLTSDSPLLQHFKHRDQRVKKKIRNVACGDCLSKKMRNLKYSSVINPSLEAVTMLSFGLLEAGIDEDGLGGSGSTY